MKQPPRLSKRPRWRHIRLDVELLESRLAPAAGLTPGQTQLLQAYGQLPLTFEINQGQTAAPVQYLSHGSGYSLFLTSGGNAVLSLQQATSTRVDPSSQAASSTGVALALSLVGANPQAAVTGLDAHPTTTSYFIGNDPSQWHTGITNYGKVEYQDVYPGVNLLYYGNQQQLEYDFQVAPGEDPSCIRFSVQGADSLSLDDQGNLVLHTASRDVAEHAPVIYQEVDSVRQMVAGQFILLSNDEVGFQVGDYDASLPLTIDPVLSYSTYLGGNGTDVGYGIAVDSTGNAYVTGYTGSSNFPTTAGGYDTLYAGGVDGFVAKFNSTGSLAWATYLGGSGEEYAEDIALDSAANAYVTGFTTSSNFPTTSGRGQK